jgi:arginine decarboxylase
MKSTYSKLIDQTYHYPQQGFATEEGYLKFNGIDLQGLIEKYGTPFKLIYLPKIREQIRRARAVFNEAILEQNYDGKYTFCYCTKCCHFYQVVSTALGEDVALETSSSFDLDLIEKLNDRGEIDKAKTIVHNGYKTEGYLSKIERLLKSGFTNSVTVLDNREELDRLEKFETQEPIKIGLRMCISEEPKAPYYTSRMGINRRDIVEFVKDRIADNPKFELVMVHFFVDSGIADNFYYWDEFRKALNLYTKIKKLAPSLHALNIGGGFPIRDSLDFEYDYGHMAREIVTTIKESCADAEVEEPDIYTEFGKYTVGESGAVIFEVLQQKQQNDSELWYIIDNSLMNTIPDAWSINEKFILLPINKWNNRYKRVNIGGISCDQSDFYNSEQMNQAVVLPTFDKNDDEPLYLGFFHTGAYQDAISGYGGIKHCLIPSPKIILVDYDKDGRLTDHIYRDEQTVDNMLQILGYHD